jgi:hypothetical protein
MGFNSGLKGLITELLITNRFFTVGLSNLRIL